MRHESLDGERVERQEQEEEEEPEQHRLKQGVDRTQRQDPDYSHSPSTPQPHATADDADARAALQQQVDETFMAADSHSASAPRWNEAADDIESRAHAVSSPRSIQGDEIRIHVKIYERGAWKDLRPLSVDSARSFDVERVMLKYIRKGIRLFDTGLGIMGPKECFNIVTGNGTNTILLIPNNEGLNISDEILKSTSEIYDNAISKTGLARKRVAVDDISRFYHARKKR